MAGRRTNLALLWVTTLAGVSGVASFLVGTAAGAWVVVAHGVLALAIVVLAPWKSAIVARSLSRAATGRWTSLGLTAAIFGAVASGLVLVTGLVEHLGPFTTMQVHVATGLLAVALTLLHAVQRPVPQRRADLQRRNLLRAAGLVGAAGGVWLLAESALDLTGLRGGRRRFTGSHQITDPEAVPATQWINDRVQHLDPATHRVEIDGVGFGAAEIAAGGDTVVATLDCTGGWYTTQEFAGTRLDKLIGGTSGTSIVARSTTGYWRRFPIEHSARLLVATHMAGNPLSAGNGGPVRIVAPGRRGYWWVKWVDTIEIDGRPAWWQPPLPLA